MPSPLSAIAPAKRKQLAATLGLFAMLFLAVGAVAATGARTTTLKVFVVVAFVFAVLLALAGWGVANSVRIDRAAEGERELDDAIAEAMSAHGGYGCGHDHDPSELHFVDGDPEGHDAHHAHGPSADACDHDGRGHECTHSCDTCVLTALRSTPASAAPAAAGAAPSTPRPSPRPSPHPSPTPRS